MMRCGLGKIMDCTDLLIEGTNALSIDLVSEEVYLSHPEDALHWVDDYPMVTEALCNMWSNSWCAILSHSGARQ